jgi:hypothetical protein
VGVLLPVHRGGGVAGEVGTGELAECLVQEAGQFAGRGRDVLAGQVRAKGLPQVGVTAQAPRLRLGVEQSRHPHGRALISGHGGSLAQPRSRSRQSHFSTFTTRAMISPAMTRAMADCSIIVIFAHLLVGSVSVGLNAVALVNAR